MYMSVVADIGHLALSLYRPRHCDKTLHSATERQCERNAAQCDIIHCTAFCLIAQRFSRKVHCNKLDEPTSLIHFENAAQCDSALCSVLSHCRAIALSCVLSHCLGRDSDSARCPTCISATLHEPGTDKMYFTAFLLKMEKIRKFNTIFLKHLLWYIMHAHLELNIFSV